MLLNQIELGLDMQISSRLATEITTTFSIKAISSFNLFYNTEKDEVIFLKTKELRNVFILTKDKDFAELEPFINNSKIILPRTGICLDEK